MTKGDLGGWHNHLRVWVGYLLRQTLTLGGAASLSLGDQPLKASINHKRFGQPEELFPHDGRVREKARKFAIGKISNETGPFDGVRE